MRDHRIDPHPGDVVRSPGGITREMYVSETWAVGYHVVSASGSWLGDKYQPREVWQAVCGRYEVVKVSP